MDENAINEKLKNVDNYFGTFSLDELPGLRLSIYPSFLIVNLDLRKNKGTHWIGIALYNNDINVCDSIGALIPNNRFPIELVNFLHLLTFKKNLHITKQLQQLSSNLCGKYSIFFIYKMSLTNNYYSYLSYFCQNLDINDCIINLLYSSIFK